MIELDGLLALGKATVRFCVRTSLCFLVAFAPCAVCVCALCVFLVDVGLLASSCLRRQLSCSNGMSSEKNSTNSHGCATKNRSIHLVYEICHRKVPLVAKSTNKPDGELAHIRSS